MCVLCLFRLFMFFVWGRSFFFFFFFNGVHKHLENTGSFVLLSFELMEENNRSFNVTS